MHASCTPAADPAPRVAQPAPALREHVLALIRETLAGDQILDVFGAHRRRLRDFFDQLTATDTLLALAFEVPLSTEGGFRHFDREVGSWLRVLNNDALRGEIPALLENAREGARILETRYARRRARRAADAEAARHSRPIANPDAAPAGLFPLGS